MPPSGSENYRMLGLVQGPTRQRVGLIFKAGKSTLRGFIQAVLCRAISLELETLEVLDEAQWRSWLAANRHSSQGVWLVFRKKGVKSLSYDEAIDGALAYGWIDSLVRKIDDARYARKFTPRKPWSIWSNLNIARVRRLRAEGRMTKWGLEAFAQRTRNHPRWKRLTSRGRRPRLTRKRPQIKIIRRPGRRTYTTRPTSRSE